MPTKKLNIISFLLLVCSCTQNVTERDKAQILGEWISEGGTIGYYFISNDTCEIRPGYIDPDLLKRPRKYFGNRTAYQISNDTLRIFDLMDNQWKDYIISFPSPTTMIMSWKESRGFYNAKYEKVKYPINSEKLFDQVIIHYDSFRKSVTLSLDSSGIFFYSGHGHRNYLKGFYTANNGKYVFKQIELLFKEANSKNVFLTAFPTRIDSIAHWKVPVITFIKNNQMVTIAGPRYTTEILMCGTGEEVYNHGYGYFPTEFMWAYEQLIFLEQQVLIKPYEKPDYWSDSRNYLEYDEHLDPVFYFENNNDKKYDFSLFLSEKFYLWTQILNAKQVLNVDFTPKYTVNGHVQSDGRYYRYKTERGDTVTLDLGFNFIEKNHLAK